MIAKSKVGLHPYVLGELLLGGLPARSEATRQLETLRKPPLASAAETAAFISWAELAGTGVGYVDTHLLISAKLVPNGTLLTSDRRLRAQAERLEVAYRP
ncbi:MAG: VapC toxin family PIN domain ribonuclease [Novosphingobium sp.]|nr:VapC toxin family PIN domain ribonuclease [Novosphingobium sp.]